MLAVVAVFAAGASRNQCDLDGTGTERVGLSYDTLE
jgi:hypothetical protein